MNVERFIRLTLSLLSILLFGDIICWAGEAQRSPKPNILFILPDQWRAQAFGFAGDPNVKTPHLDRLASQGVRFINALAGMPVCCPSRASLLTGQRPLTTGVFMNDVPLDPNALTLAKVLSRAGLRYRLHRQVAPEWGRAFGLHCP